MTELDTGSKVPAVVRYNRKAVDEIINCANEGIYCAVLGPRLSGKTVLLRYVAQTLSETLGWTSIYIDLYDMRASTLQGFFADLIGFIAAGIQERTGLDLPVPGGSVASSAVFRGFLTDSACTINRDLVLFIEHLEAMPTDLVQALLTSLRAAFMDQQTEDYRVMVVVSGALSLATLTVGESSPFRGIARRVFVGDLSESQSAALIAELLEAKDITISRRAQRRLLLATNGDPFLIRQVCRWCIEVTRSTSSRRLRGKSVKHVMHEFLRKKVYEYAPLQEAVRLIEKDPDLLRCMLLLLAHGTVPKAELPLPLSPDFDPLYLTGVVEQDGDTYRIQNQIYSQFLAQHFHPGRVGHLLSMAGRWDPAIDYLEVAIREGNEQARADLLPATINSMYASENVNQAAHFLIRGLSAAFGVADARVWFAPPQEKRLQLVGTLGQRADSALEIRSEMPISADRLEARAYRQAIALRGPEGERRVWRAIPLLPVGHRPIGVVMLCDDQVGNLFVEQRERDLQVLGYLNQAARAIQVVSTRRQELALAGRMQASLLPNSPPEVDGWQFAATLRPARETSGDFYDFIPLPGDRMGLVIADVTDKGMGAALYMALCRTLIRTYAADYADRPDLTLNAANQRILAETGADLFITVFYGILDPSSGTLTYCNAGHHPPLLFSLQAQDQVQTLPGRGIALGVIQDTRWGHTTVQLQQGTRLLLYTDGVVDALNPEKESFGNERLRGFIEASSGHTAQDIQDNLLAQLQRFTGNEPQFDDITLMAVVRNPQRPSIPTCSQP